MAPRGVTRAPRQVTVESHSGPTVGLVTIRTPSGTTPPRLFIAAKAPRPGFAKTRLGAVVGHEQAARLYAAFLADLGTRFPQAGWYVTPGDAWPEIAAGAGADGQEVLVQPVGDWTERQRHLLREVSPALLMASDSPQLAPAYVEAASDALTTHDLVLGPTEDGGYALIGLRRWHDVLGGVTMSQEDVLDRILRRARDLGLRVHLLPPTYDVDEVRGLDRLREEVRHRDDLPATAAALEEVLVGV